MLVYWKDMDILCISNSLRSAYPKQILAKTIIMMAANFAVANSFL